MGRDPVRLESRELGDRSPPFASVLGPEGLVEFHVAPVALRSGGPAAARLELATGEEEKVVHVATVLGHVGGGDELGHRSNPGLVGGEPFPDPMVPVYP